MFDNNDKYRQGICDYNHCHYIGFLFIQQQTENAVCTYKCNMLKLNRQSALYDRKCPRRIDIRFAEALQGKYS